MFAVYLFLSQTSLDVFNCQAVVGKDGESDGKEYMAVSAIDY
jgi:hypothetical protein